MSSAKVQTRDRAIHACLREGDRLWYIVGIAYISSDECSGQEAAASQPYHSTARCIVQQSMAGRKSVRSQSPPDTTVVFLLPVVATLKRGKHSWCPYHVSSPVQRRFHTSPRFPPLRAHAPLNIETIQSLPPPPSPSTPAFLNTPAVRSTTAGSTPTTSPENRTVCIHSRTSLSE